MIRTSQNSVVWKNYFSTLFIHKIKEYETYLTILLRLPPPPLNFSIIYTKGHQD